MNRKKSRPYLLKMSKVSRLLRWSCTTCLSVWALNMIVIIGFCLFFSQKPYSLVMHKGERLLVFAAHQDDGVIEAGGLVLQNHTLGGRNLIVYLTRPSIQVEADIRKREARNAWSLVSQEIKLIFLDFPSERDWSKSKQEHATLSIVRIINNYRPSLIVIPLKERGHPEHDLLNEMVKEASRRFGNVRIFQSSEYNPYLILENTPGKVIWFLDRLLPFMPYKDPNYGLVPANQLKLSMTEQELKRKKEMLSMFVSQKDVIPMRQFGYPDLFDSTNELPSNVFKVKGKYLSTWTVFTLATNFIVLFCWGVLMSLSRKKCVRFSAFFIALVTCICIIFTRSYRVAFEDLLYLITFTGGVLFCNAITVLYFLSHKVNGYNDTFERRQD